MHTKRVLVWASGLLLGAGVENLLTPESDLEVIGVEAEGEVELLREIERSQPDVVFLDECNLKKDGNILARLLSGYPNLCVIITGPEDNWLHFYHRQEILITQASDLANLIRSY